MTSIMIAGKSDHLWHEMRASQKAVCGFIEDDRLRCCICGRPLRRDDFSLEHIIPRQAVTDDPISVKTNMTVSLRSGHILLCRASLTVKGHRPQGNGCNGWKGGFYDPLIRKLSDRSILEWRQQEITEQVCIAAFAVAYLAMVARFGYQIVFTPAGVIARKQFLSPTCYLPALPLMSKIILTGLAPLPSKETLDFWSAPFHFRITDD